MSVTLSLLHLLFCQEHCYPGSFLTIVFWNKVFQILRVNVVQQQSDLEVSAISTRNNSLVFLVTFNLCCCVTLLWGILHSNVSCSRSLPPSAHERKSGVSFSSALLSGSTVTLPRFFSLSLSVSSSTITLRIPWRTFRLPLFLAFFHEGNCSRNCRVTEQPTVTVLSLIFM